MQLDKNMTGLVRVKVSFGYWRCPCISMDETKQDENHNLICKGFWHRHDEDDLEEKLDKDVRTIIRAYSTMSQYEGCMYCAEWRDYEG